MKGMEMWPKAIMVWKYDGSRPTRPKIAEVSSPGPEIWFFLHINTRKILKSCSWITMYILLMRGGGVGHNAVKSWILFITFWLTGLLGAWAIWVIMLPIAVLKLAARKVLPPQIPFPKLRKNRLKIHPRPLKIVFSAMARYKTRFVQNPLYGRFLPDSGVSGVRSMDPGVCTYKNFVWDFADVTLADDDTNSIRLMMPI